MKIKRIIALFFVLNLAAVTAFCDTHSDSWTLDIKPGSSYSHLKWFGIFPIKAKPLIAVWLEDKDGNLLQTLYITGKAAENNWRGGAKERPESLPVYFASRDRSGLREEIDTISAASTGNEPEVRSFSEKFPSQTARIMAEVNISYDFNDFYTEESSGVNGQPSLVYQSDWLSGERSYTLKPIGTGSVSGTNGKINPDLSYLSTALNLLKEITLTW